jgi:hypothetical protein
MKMTQIQKIYHRYNPLTIIRILVMAALMIPVIIGPALGADRKPQVFTELP